MNRDARAELDLLLRRLGDGDRSAFPAAYAVLWPLVREFCVRAAPRGLEEDAAQLALWKVFERASTYDPDRDALTWTLAIAAWECRTQRKKRQRLREAGDGPLATAEDVSSSAEDVLAQLGRSEALRSLVQTLAPTDRETIQRILDDDGGSEAASPALRKRRQRALDRLRAAWRRIYGES